MLQVLREVVVLSAYDLQPGAKFSRAGRFVETTGFGGALHRVFPCCFRGRIGFTETSHYIVQLLPIISIK